MKKQKRRLVFYVLACVFFLLTPIIIGYALGYTFDFGRGAVQKTGSIFIKSKNTSISLFLDGAFIKETSFFPGGALLPEIVPGTHLLRIEKTGFSSWSKTITIEPALVTELRNIMLIPHPVPIATSTKEELQMLKTHTAQLKNTPEDSFVLDKKKNLILRTGETGVEKIAGNVYSFSRVGAVIFFVDNNGFLARYDPAEKIVTTIGRPGFYLQKRPVVFVGSPAGDVAVIDEASGLFMVDARDKITPQDRGIMKAVFSLDGSILLLVKENEIKTLLLRDRAYQPFEKRGDTETIFKVNRGLRDATWFYGDNAHIAVSTNDGISFLELDGRGGRNVVSLTENPVNELFSLPEEPRSVFFKKGKNTYTIRL